MTPFPLGRRTPKDFEHVAAYPLTAAPSAATPVVLGVAWYDSFFRPTYSSGRWWIARDSNWGPVAGGHAICARPEGVTDLSTWYKFYDQGTEGACVGFSLSRAVSLMNRLRYDARWLYLEAQKIDEWEGGAYDGASPRYEGTSVRSGADILVSRGHCRIAAGVTYPEDPVQGIRVYRWARTVDEVVASLREMRVEIPKRLRHVSMGAIPLLNSWGTSYPRVVWLPFEALDRLLSEDGECAVLVDR